MKVLLTGADGQLGRTLVESLPDKVELLPFTQNSLDITHAVAVTTAVERESPDLIINAAAYTAVDKAESEPDLCHAVNGAGAGYLADAADNVGARMIQISTDFVFDGTQSTPYRTDDMPAPINVYGTSKLEGERLVANRLGDRAVILRSAWIYSPHGSNFLLTMLRLLEQRESLDIVADQIGTPTSTRSLAAAIWACAAQPALTGIHHWTDAGVASWYDFAIAIQEEASRYRQAIGNCTVSPIRSEEYPTAAKRPTYSVMDKTRTSQELGMDGEHWRRALRGVIQGMELQA